MVSRLTALLLAAPLAAMAACPGEADIASRAAAWLARQPAMSYGPGLSLADGLCAQERLIAALTPAMGPVVGYKVGLTNAAAQQRFGVPHPLRGAMYRQTFLDSGAHVPARFGAVPAVESDLLVRVASADINTATDHVAILRAIDRLVPFIELPDLVLAQGQLLDGPNLLAINVGARLGVMGHDIPIQATPEFAARLGTMTVTLIGPDGAERSRAPGTALLGHPLNVIPWLVADLRAAGRQLEPGQIVSLGGFSPALPAAAGTWRARYEGLDSVPREVAVTLTE
jgi:2-keto-4-pentenoate hydratase